MNYLQDGMLLEMVISRQCKFLAILNLKYVECMSTLSLYLSEHIIYVDGISTTMQKVPFIFFPHLLLLLFLLFFRANTVIITGRVACASPNETTAQKSGQQNYNKNG